jgi:hypothetical protein
MKVTSWFEVNGEPGDEVLLHAGNNTFGKLSDNRILGYKYGLFHGLIENCGVIYKYRRISKSQIKLNVGHDPAPSLTITRVSLPPFLPIQELSWHGFIYILPAPRELSQI